MMCKTPCFQVLLGTLEGALTLTVLELLDFALEGGYESWADAAVWAGVGGAIAGISLVAIPLRRGSIRGFGMTLGISFSFVPIGKMLLSQKGGEFIDVEVFTGLGFLLVGYLLGNFFERCNRWMTKGAYT